MDARTAILRAGASPRLIRSGARPARRAGVRSGASVRVPGALRASANKRYLVDQDGTPFFLWGDSPQSVFTSLFVPDVENYIRDRARAGCTVVYYDAVAESYTSGQSDGSSKDGLYPFVGMPGTTDITKPNEPYWVEFDYVTALVVAHGLVPIIDPMETGSWLPMMRSAGTAGCQTFGRFIGARLARYPAVIYQHGNDFNGTSHPSASDVALVQAMITGIRSVAPHHLHTIELEYFESDSMEQASDNWQDYLDLNAAYTYHPTYDRVLQAYNRTPTMPVFMTEARYEFEEVGDEDTSTPTPMLTMRKQVYWSVTSGACGHLFGDHYTMGFPSGYPPASEVDTPGLGYMQIAAQFVASYPWWDVVPDPTAVGGASPQVVTAGRNTYEAGATSVTNTSYVTAAWTTDGHLIMAYVPATSTLTVDMSTCASSSITARWFDPTNGAYQSAGAGLTNSGTHAFASPGANNAGDHDWVLVIES